MNSGFEQYLYLSAAAAVLFAGSLALTKTFVSRKERQSIRARLESLLESKGPSSENQIKLKTSSEDSKLSEGRKEASAGLPGQSFYKHLKQLHSLSQIKIKLDELIQMSLLGALILAVLPFALELPAALAILSPLVPIASYLILKFRAENLRNKFLLQLPNAIDLMVSILKSGHSIPQAVRSVAEESPQPCSGEFTQIFNRMNLGQSLPESMQKSVEKYDSFELDLIRRASSLNQEVGGSLSEVLEKTNETLRQRIKLKNQIAVMTTQGKLSAWICALLPLVVAIAFSQMNPDYLKPLLSSTNGQLMLAAALALELAGFFIMRKLASFRI